jgi:hypothetical protein
MTNRCPVFQIILELHSHKHRFTLAIPPSLRATNCPPHLQTIHIFVHRFLHQHMRCYTPPRVLHQSRVALNRVTLHMLSTHSPNNSTCKHACRVHMLFLTCISITASLFPRPFPLSQFMNRSTHRLYRINRDSRQCVCMSESVDGILTWS